MTLNQLRYFKMTAETGNLRQAAEKLYISQPSLSIKEDAVARSCLILGYMSLYLTGDG